MYNIIIYNKLFYNFLYVFKSIAKSVICILNQVLLTFSNIFF